MITQTAAIFIDSLRLLKSRSLFWLSLGLSAVAAIGLFGLFSFNETGIRFLWMDTMENPTLVKGSPGSRAMVAGLFNGMFVKFWLSWGAMILAIISTASILPEFLAGGAIDMTLSKPISRARLFALKFAGSLMFVCLQVAIGVSVAYLVIGLKFDLWLHSAFLAIPLLTLQFFYLYSVSALIAVLLRSTLAALIGTVLFWFAVFLVQFAANQLDGVVAQSQSQVDSAEERIVRYEAMIERGGRPAIRANLRLPEARMRRDTAQSSLDNMKPWQQRIKLAETFVPKTGDIQKILAGATEAPVQSEFRDLFEMDLDQFKPEGMSDDEWEDAFTAETAGERAIRDVNITSSLVTSSAFSLVVLGASIFVFTRRDF